MRIIAFIDQPEFIEKILTHLRLCCSRPWPAGCPRRVAPFLV